MRPRPRLEMKPKGPETSGTSVEYTVGEDEDVDMDSDFEKADDSTSSESDDDDKASGGSNSSSTDDSSDSSHNPPSKKSPAGPRSPGSPMCSACGRGPFRSMKLHLRHCSRLKMRHPCSRCNEVFVTEQLLNEHYMPLYACDTCSQVFPHENSYRQHPCPKGSKSPLVLFCSESMPQACNICKCFFTCEKTLLNHITKVHMSVVSTKVCIITNPSALADKKLSPGATAAQSSSPNVTNPVINGKLHVSQTSAGSQPTAAKSSPSCPSPSSSQPGTPAAPMCSVSSAEPAQVEKDGAQGQPADQPSSQSSPPACVPGTGPTEKTAPGEAAAEPASPPTPTVIAMFENDSHDLALMKRMNTGWRSKATYPCRQCGAILRQPSLVISHRYLHRGHRSHQCQCGRTFKHQLHLLRHCVQHAEKISYICASCGETFTGAKLLADHIRGKPRKKPRTGHKWKRNVKKKCRAPFTCDCGQLFFRPSAYIWHQLRNRTKTKPPSKKKHSK